VHEIILRLPFSFFLVLHQFQQRRKTRAGFRGNKSIERPNLTFFHELLDLGLRAGEFITLVKYAASLANTKLIEFSEMNPKYDIDNTTAKLVAIAMHRFISHLA